jgi:hypothetical protein
LRGRGEQEASGHFRQRPKRLGQAGQTEIEQNVLEETQKNKGKNVMFYLTSFFPT